MIRLMRQFVPPLILSLAMLSSAAWGDALVVTKAMTATTIAEIFVESDGIRVEMEIGTADLPAFANLLPDRAYQQLGHAPRPAAQRQKEFFERDWIIRSDDDEPLIGRITKWIPQTRVRRDEITGKPLTMQPADAESVLFVEMRYSWTGRPRSLTFERLTHFESGGPAANIGFIVYHDSLPVNDFRYLPPQSTIDLDWDDPWYSRFRHRNLQRRHIAPLSVFLYVEYFEVRKEIIIRPKDLQHWVDLGLAGKATIAAKDRDALKQRVVQYLGTRHPVIVDGRPVKGTLDRIHFIRRTLRTTGVVDPGEDLDVTSATLGVIFVYPIERLPQEVTMRWDLFSERISQVTAVATDETPGLLWPLTPDDPQIVWKNLLTNPTVPAMKSVSPPPPMPTVSIPVVSIVFLVVALPALLFAAWSGIRGRGMLIGPLLVTAVLVIAATACLSVGRATIEKPFARRPTIEPKQAQEVLHSLLYNVYRAFDRRDESLVYDRLAQSISGELLEDVYLQIRRSMELENQGGASVKIDNVEVLDVTEQPTTDGSYAYRCQWNASGSVGHWGHIHRRTNQYDAVITMQPDDRAWKITAIDLREEKRIDPGVAR